MNGQINGLNFLPALEQSIYIDRISVKKSINSRNKERGKEVLNRKLEGCKAPLCWKRKRGGKKERKRERTPCPVTGFPPIM